ncbi:MAG: P-loop NTPase [Chloroflexi bacterium]|nr:P-loop NTPase [Chloroflexota bacterium]
MTTISILLLAAAADAAGPVAETLGAAGRALTTVTDPDEAIRRAGEFSLVAIDTVEPPRTAVEVCAEIRRTPALAGVPVLCLARSDDVEERVRFLEAGADDVVGRPFDPRELEARIEGLLIRFQRSRDLAPLAGGEATITTRRHVLACFSPKGGTGTTTIAVNVATALAAHVPDQVAILDLDLSFGQVATHLNVKPRLTLSDLAADDLATREPDVLRTYAEKAEGGLHVFAAPATPEHARIVEPAHVEQILATAARAYRALVVDAGAALDERALAVLDRADAVILPVVPEVGALKALHGLLEFLTEQGAVPAKSTFVLNHLFARDLLAIRQIENAIASRVDAELPYDPALYLKAVNEGVPVVRGAPGSAPAKALIRVASLASGIDDLGEPAPETRRGGLLGGLRRRG